MAKVDFVVRIAGENGENVLSVGDFLAQAMARAGLNIYTFKNLPAEIKGGASMVQVRVSDGRVRTPGDGVDILFAWNQENYDIHQDQVRDGGIILYDPAECTPDPAVKHSHYAVPLTEIANQEIGERRTKNLIALSTLAGLTGLSEEVVETLVQKRLGRRLTPAQLEVYSRAVKRGYEFARTNLPTDRFRVTGLGAVTGSRMIMTGNTAISLGAMAAGLQYYAGYPITPASDIMELLAKQLPRVGGVLVQTEDEIAAICSCIGATFAGRKVMTATSGPGLSLMVEAMGLATMQEAAMVIVDVQRGGPSTGLPTKVEQSDLELAVYGHHGDAPRIVLAPTSVNDLFWGTIQAFNLAEKYQVPVILLSDQHLSHREVAIPPPDLTQIEIVDRKTPDPDDEADYQRYAVTDDGISTVAIPGVHSSTWVATGLEHDEHAHIAASSAKYHVVMSDKRARKVAGAAEEPRAVLRFGNPNAKFGVISWGSGKGPLQEAVERLADQGIEIQALIARMIFPVPERQIQEFLDSVDNVAVMELNHSGQYAHLLQSTFCRRVIPLRKYDGLPFKTAEVCDMIEEAIRSAGGAAPTRAESNGPVRAGVYPATAPVAQGAHLE